MKAGRELDALVAEKVMGRAVHFGLVHNPLYFEGHRKGCPCCWIKVPHYSNSLAAAWEVVEKIEGLEPKGGGDGELVLVPGKGAAEVRWDRGGCNGDWEGLVVLAKAETMPHAICLAALKVVGA